MSAATVHPPAEKYRSAPPVQGTRPRQPSARKSVGKGFVIAAVGVWLILVLGPYVVMLLTSLTPQQELLAPGSQVFPENPTFDAYKDLAAGTPFFQFLGNSAMVAFGTVVVSLLAATTTAISLSRFRFRGRQTVLTSLLIAQLFPAVLLVIPLQGELRQFGLLDTIPGLILINTTFATPFAVWLLKGFLDSLPASLDEAARIDGCSAFQMVRYILLPLMKPGLTAAGTYIFIFSWNEFLYALTFTQSNQTHTVPVGLHLFIGEYQIRWDLLTAGGVVAAIPVLLGFMLVQRNLIEGLTAGAVKG
ncbi:carbohydrate ABC transporter permease [Arthrobacter sp. Sa2BUA2]|uniref:Carbohydrate ABC transporter permease n=1 Tax=Arthrobacter pullicola TaxID=2762224 RepID=A0ABR8YM01_9MICC|nr:carbohydrate ABC transporter permease [Arthrobacter pullicola]MBD8045285.1 carbohydrate ABC transporter permease [Arthrobacter pullicola]